MTKFDDASWHYGGDFPEGLPPSAGATHIGMFLAWCIGAGLGGEELLKEYADDVARLRRREITPGAFMMGLDGKLVDDQLDETGNAFAVAYYSGRDDEAPYIDDYVDVFTEETGESVYEVRDTWASFDRLAPVVRGRFESWTAAGSPEFL